MIEGVFRTMEVNGVRREVPEQVAREATSLYELFLTSGADPGVAKLKVTELYSPPRSASAVGRLPIMTLRAGSTFDLRMDRDGRSWNFLREADRREARRRVKKEHPALVIGSPPCPAEAGRRKWEARVLFEFALEIYGLQLVAGRHFLQ